MTTTKRDFEAVAAVVARANKRCKTKSERLVVEFVAVHLADYFAGQNDRFKLDQFLAACKGADE